MSLTSVNPWERRAPERAGLPSAWALLPEQLAALGCPGAPGHAFGRLQRVLTWGRAPGADAPDGQLFLARDTRAWLAERTDMALPRIVERHPSEDGATKLVLALSDGHRIEAIHMPRRPDGRVTFCVSSQVGCALGCTFCATGAMGIVRNLSAGEIVGQVLVLMHELGPKRGDLLTLVFMGMGEPLHNLDHVHRAIQVLCFPLGAGLSARRITVSTAGLVPGIERLAKMIPRPQLAVSLNATTDAQRSATMPINRAFPLARLRQALADWPLEKNERFLFEYVLLAGENDTNEDADRLAAWLGDLRHRHNVNLIPMNEHGRSAFREPEGERVQRFLRRLREHGCFVSVRKSRSRDVQGACGQLAGDPEQITGVLNQNSGDLSQNSGDLGQNTGDPGQNTGDLSQNSGDPGQNTGDLSQNSGDLGQNSGVLSQDSGVLSQDSGVLSQDTGVPAQITGVLSQNSGVLA